MTARNALVLGGGGPVGAAWLSAALSELVAAGLPLGESGVVLGTSAGAVSGAWLTMDPDGLPEVPQRMVKRARQHAAALAAGQGDQGLFQRLLAESGGDVRKIARAAIATFPPMTAEQGEALWSEMLPQGQWPANLRAAAVNAETGAAHAWSSTDGIPLAVAVSTSTAAPGFAAPVSVDGSIWVDGGVRSGTNADLIADLAAPGRVLVLAPIGGDGLAREEASLTERGYRVRVIVAERFYGPMTDLLDPGFVDLATTVGARQARDCVADLATWWNS
jgi:NTE family protein